MCGIAGIFHRHPERIDHSALERAARALGHRGPDACGIEITGHVGLVHTRLSIIDLAGGQQPLHLPSRALSLVANGEIYNARSLFAAWAQEGCHPATASDCEAIQHAYAREGESGIARLHGMFAFALHDARSQTLLLGRDRLGIKPLFYAQHGDWLAFASELHALLALLPQTPPLRARALIQYLQADFTSGSETIFEGVRRLPPGTTLSIDARIQPRLQHYWHPAATGQADADPDAFGTLMRTVVREHEIADVPYGLFLSGGIDSAILCALLQQDQPGLPTFSLGYTDTPARNELDDARHIASRFGTNHHELTLAAGPIFERLPLAVHATDELMLDYAVLPTLVLAEAASQVGLKVIFTGEGSDEVFAGYGRYRRNRWQRFWENLRAPGSGGLHTHGNWPGKLGGSLFGPQLNAEIGAWRQAYIDAWQQSPKGGTALQHAQCTDLATDLADKLLVKVDRALMRFGVEGRVPYLDHRIVEFGLSLPDRDKVRGRTGKVFLRRWAEQLLPREHLYRRKLGFHLPAGRFFTPQVLDGLRARLPNAAGIREWLVPAGVRALIDDHRAGRSHTHQLWSLLQFALWYQMFVAAPGPVPGPRETPLDWLG